MKQAKKEEQQELSGDEATTFVDEEEQPFNEID